MLKKHLAERGFETRDYGTYSPEACDFPDYAEPLCKAVQAGEFEKGILVCGTGIGMSILANRHSGIRAAVCTNAFMAKATREHNNANILCMGARVISPETCVELTDIFLDTPFSEDERHIRRLAKIPD